MDKPESEKETPQPPGVLRQETPPAAEKRVEKPPSPVKADSPLRTILRIALFALLGALVFFLAGMLVALAAFTWPAQDELKGVGAELRAEQALTQQQQDELGSLQNRLAALEAEQAEFQGDLEVYRLQVALLNGLADAMSARLALAEENDTGLRLALSNLARSLTTLDGLVQADQKAVIAALQEDLASIQKATTQATGGGTGSSIAAAQADLDVLIENLMQLRDSLVTRR